MNRTILTPLNPDDFQLSALQQLRIDKGDPEYTWADLDFDTINAEDAANTHDPSK
jgi:hypothetical protein